MDRQTLRAMGFSEEAINERLGPPESRFKREDIVHVWKLVKSKRYLTTEQDRVFKEMIKEYNLDSEKSLPKLKYKIKD